MLKFAWQELEGPVVVAAFPVSLGRIPPMAEVSVPPMLSGIGKGTVKCASSLGIRETQREMARALLYNLAIGRL